MSCPNYKRLCERLVISQSVSFANNTLIINIPQMAYNNNEKYCIVVAQNIPDTATITAPVVITIGENADTTYPVLNCDCTTVYACSINRRTRYSMKVKTGIQDGAFVLLNRLPCSRCSDRASSLPLPAAVTPTE